jgi:DNA-directed RNA polymerase subunit N (RpoN/RPB10)
MEKKKQIIKVNKIKCKKCGNIIESKTTNDLKRCSCGAVAVDGGKEYLKRIGNDEEYEELSIMTEEVK